MITLLEKIASEQSLLNAWYKLDKSNLDSHGVSGVTVEQFKKNYEERISSISQELLDNNFTFSATRAVAILKKKGKYRPLQIPEIKDRIVLKSIALELESHFKPLLDKSKGLSFAYQKGLGVRNAIKKIGKLYNKGNEIILEADIKNFFGEVDKESLLLKDIFPNLPDDTINDLIVQGLSQPLNGITSLSKQEALAFKDVDTGIPQGNALSPLLSNIFLSPFDLFLKSKGFQLVRYADDFVVLCENEEQALECFNLSSQFLKNKLCLELYDLDSEKSAIVNPTKERFIFLSVEFDGEKFFPSQESFDKLKNKMRSVCNLPANRITLIDLLTKVKNRLEGWVSAFFYTDMDRYVEELDFFIDRQVLLGIRKFQWRLTSESKGELPTEYRNGERFKDCLSRKQRKGSGIPLASETLKRIRDKVKNKEKVKNVT